MQIENMRAKNNYTVGLFLCVVMIAMVSCGKSELSDVKQYKTYLSDPEHGLVKQKSIAGLSIKVRYLPEDYLAYNLIKDMENCDKVKKDSIAATYSNSLTYLVTIGPAENENFDVTRVGVADYEEFAARIEEMSFHAQDWFTLAVKEKEYKPEIVRLETINALEKSRNFIVVFNSPQNTEADFRKSDMKLSYSDELFNTGVNHFMFYAKDIQAIPKFIF